MKISKKTILTLTEKEASWLKNLVKNPTKSLFTEQAYCEENKNDQQMREDLFHLLS